MKRTAISVLVVWVCLGYGEAASGQAPPREFATPPPPDVTVSPQAGPQVATAPVVDPAERVDNVSIFPIRSTTQQDVGPLTTLDSAIARKVASVREVGSGPNGENAEVNRLIIDNRGNVPIYVLAGTIVTGGKQDRQVGDDFIVGAHQSVPVDAYCIEHGRWTTTRNGAATGGQFGVSAVMTESPVRVAAQYEHDQSSVWSKVAAVNAVHRKEAPSGTLMATVDSRDVAAKRAALVQRMEARLRAAPSGDEIVGIAYAIDGKVRSARWFASHKIFELFRSTLISTAAMEAVTAQSVAANSGAPGAPVPTVAPDVVTRFLAEIQASPVKEERATPAMNVNDIRASSVGYGASTVLKAGAGGAAAPAKPVSTSATSF
jgi:ARG/rhodanese/phosphatase superfamily protein